MSEKIPEITQEEWNRTIEKADRLAPTVGGVVRSSLKRENMEIDAWKALVEDSASALAESLSSQLRRPLKAEVDWHGHAEVFILPTDSESWKIEKDEETGEEFRFRTDSVLRIWVD